jgi:hypothetical protein
VALSENQLRECLSAVGAFIAKRRPPESVREKLDYRADIEGQVVTVVSIRPAYNDPNRMLDSPIARARWIGTKQKWRLFWMRADLKWHAYEPMLEAPTLAAVLQEVDRDPHGCFFG